MDAKRNRRFFLKQGVMAGTGFALSCICGCRKSQKSKSVKEDNEPNRKEEAMEKMIAYCGLICNSECPAFIATQKDDDEARKKVAERWSSEKYPLRPEDINCDGCLVVDGRLLAFCKDCEARRCGLARGVKNCAYCEEYPCEKLDDMHRQAPKAKLRLDEIRKNL